MNRAEIHEQISDISERILKLNQNLIEARRILPVELDLLKSYQAELERLIQVLANADRATGATSNTQGNAVTETAPRAKKEPQQAVEAPATEPEELAFDVPVVEPETGAEPRVPLHVEDEVAETEAEQEQQEPETPELKTEAFEFNVTQEETGAEPRVEIQVEEPQQEPEPETPEANIPQQETEEVEVPEVIPETTSEEEPVAEKEEAEEVELPEEPVNVAHAKPEEVTVETDKTDKPQELATDDYEDEDEQETKGSADEERKLSINDRFKQQEPDLGYRVRPHAGTRNLRDMIDLSEKYVYARELFGGDTDFFERTLHYLNKCNSYSEAQNYINSELKGKYNWEQKQPIEQRFTKLLKAKFEVA